MEPASLKYKKVLNESASGSGWKAFILLLAGLVLTIASALYTVRIVESGSESDFTLLCRDIKSQIDYRLQSQSQLLRSGSSFFSAVDTVTHSKWAKFMEREQILKISPALQGVGFSLLVPKNQLEQHIQNIRKEGYPDYNIKPFGDREIYTSVVYCEPFHSFGFDMYSEPVRRNAMKNAQDSNEAAISAKVNLIMDSEKDLQTGFLMFFPIYHNGKQTNTIEERRAAIVGWVYVPCRMDDFMKGILNPCDSIGKNGIQLQIYDDDCNSPDSLLFNSQRNYFSGYHDLQSATLDLPVVFNGKKWKLCFSHSVEKFSYFNNKVIYVLIVGIAISFLLFGLLISIINSRSSLVKTSRQLLSDLKESEIRFKMVADFSYDWEYWEERKDGRIIYMSPSCQRISGYKNEEFLSDNLLMKKIIHPGDSKLYDEHFEKAHSTEYLHGTSEFEYRIITKDGSIIYIAHLCTPVFDNHHNYFGKRVSIRDITERKRLETLLMQSEQELGKVVADKEKFISVLMSDLWNTFVYFSGLTKTMSQELQSLTMAEIQQLAVNMRKSANNLYSLIDNLIQWARMRQRLVLLNQDVIQLLPVVIESLATIEESAKFREVELKYDIKDNLEVYADGKMLQTIIRNLVLYLLNITPEGGKIIISAKHTEEGDVELSISDCDAVMSRRIDDKLFQSDIQTLAGNTGDAPGIGPGLQLCREIVEIQGGKIWADSEEGKGSTIHFTIACKVKKQEDIVVKESVTIDMPDSKINPEGLGLKILIADNDKGSARLLSISSKHFSSEILSAESGAEAIETCRNNPDIDLVLMDIELPDMDGYEATRQIRQFNSDVVIIAYTAYALSDDWGNSITAGCNDYIAKPITKDQLIVLVQKYFKHDFIA